MSTVKKNSTQECCPSYDEDSGDSVTSGLLPYALRLPIAGLE